ncbi:MAG: V-type ATP synthase subunit E family protein [Anaerovoracaceae bacterium]
MSIEKITSSIIADAKAEAKRVTEEGQIEAAKILNEAKAKAQAMKDKAQSEGQIEKEKLIERRKSVSEIDGKKAILAKKQEQIDICFAKAMDKIATMDKTDYLVFLMKLLKETGETSGEIILNPKDKEGLGQEFLQEANNMTGREGFSLSEETRNFAGGFILKRGKIYVNGTIEQLVEGGREAIAREVANRLFW